MKVVGKVESLWRYPVKSMRGEELREAFVGFPGVYGDRLYAFRSSAAPKGFPYLTGRSRRRCCCIVQLSASEHATRPENLAEAEAIGSGLTPGTDLRAHGGYRDAIGRAAANDDPRLIDMLREGIRDTYELTLLRSDRAMTDCRPVSIISIQTARRVSEESGVDLDKRALPRECLYGARIRKCFRRGRFCWPDIADWRKDKIAVIKRDSAAR